MGIRTGPPVGRILLERAGKKAVYRSDLAPDRGAAGILRLHIPCRSVGGCPSVSRCLARFGSDKVQEGNEEVIPWKTPYILSISQNDETATDLKREAAAVFFVIVSTQIDRLGRVITYLSIPISLSRRSA